MALVASRCASRSRAKPGLTRPPRVRHSSKIDGLGHYPRYIRQISLRETINTRQLLIFEVKNRPKLGPTTKISLASRSTSENFLYEIFLVLDAIAKLTN